MIQAPELLAPAGKLKTLRYAFAYGADAVYAGLPRYSLRVRENDFKLDNLAAGIHEAHSARKAFYVAINIAPHNNKVRTFLREIEPIVAMRPDALIMSDPGLIMMAREYWPDMPIHLSVQANAVNWATVKFWHRQGVRRVILSRELSLDEIEEIRMRVPEIELEAFVHGALCMAYSGRCLLAGYFNHRDPNQGACTNACRWKYRLHSAQTDVTGSVIAPAATNEDIGFAQPTLGQGSPSQGAYLLEDPSRPGELMPAWEDEHGTYIMNSKDLRAIEHVERLARMGIHSLKIEGRTKSHYYAARSVQAYRQAIDDAVDQRPFDSMLLHRLESLSSRGYTEGFYRRHSHSRYQTYEEANSGSTGQQFVAEAIGYSETGRLKLCAKNKFHAGDWVELMTPKGNHAFQLQDIRLLNNEAPINEVPGSDYKVSIPLPNGVDASAGDFGLLIAGKKSA